VHVVLARVERLASLVEAFEFGLLDAYLISVIEFKGGLIVTLVDERFVECVLTSLPLSPAEHLDVFYLVEGPVSPEVGVWSQGRFYANLC